jgi:REP element-mobilizing transposase RayT
MMVTRTCLRTWHGNHGKRLPRVCYEGGHPIHVIVCTRDRRPVFLAKDFATVTFELIASNPVTIAASLMPDHLHWLMAAEEESFSSLIGRFKSVSTRIAWCHGHDGKLWQRSYFDHIVRSSESCRRVAQYIVENPVRAGLVADWHEYPHSVFFEERCPL